MAVQERFSIPIPSEKMLVELAAMPNSIQFAALSYLKLDTVARGLGFVQTQNKNGKIGRAHV